MGSGKNIPIQTLMRSDVFLKTESFNIIENVPMKVLPFTKALLPQDR